MAITSRRYRRQAPSAEQIAALIRELTAQGLDPDDVAFAIDGRLPDLSLRTFVGGLALVRSQEDAEYALLVHGGALQ
jgi:hypothetical protein